MAGAPKMVEEVGCLEGVDAAGCDSDGGGITAAEMGGFVEVLCFAKLLPGCVDACATSKVPSDKYAGGMRCNTVSALLQGVTSCVGVVCQCCAW